MTSRLVTFPSSHAAMEAELSCEDAGLRLRLIPLPPSISAGCGLALLFDSDITQPVMAVLRAGHIPFEAVYKEEGRQWTRQSD